MALGLAWLRPQIGARGGPLHPEVFIRAGVVFVFFLHGVRLPLEALRRGVAAWRAHLVAQCLGFLVLPLLGLGLLSLFPSLVPAPLAVGVFFMCALPGTMASSAMLTAVAGGNMGVALFDSALSSLLGVVLTPAWVGLAMRGPLVSRGFLETLVELFALLVLPVLVGQLCRGWFERRRRAVSKLSGGGLRKWARAFDPVVVLFIAYSVFCDAFAGHLFSRVDPLDLVVVGVACGALLFLGLAIGEGLGRLLGVARDERIAACFCGASKSLAVGVPMAAVVYGDRPELALVLLPLMLYHPIQLFSLGLLSTRLARSAAAAGSAHSRER